MALVIRKIGNIINCVGSDEMVVPRDGYEESPEYIKFRFDLEKLKEAKALLLANSKLLYSVDLAESISYGVNSGYRGKACGGNITITPYGLTFYIVNENSDNHFLVPLPDSLLEGGM